MNNGHVDLTLAELSMSSIRFEERVQDGCEDEEGQRSDSEDSERVVQTLCVQFLDSPVSGVLAEQGEVGSAEQGLWMA
jgi:hypothetical protein